MPALKVIQHKRSSSERCRRMISSGAAPLPTPPPACRASPTPPGSPATACTRAWRGSLSRELFLMLCPALGKTCCLYSQNSRYAGHSRASCSRRFEALCRSILPAGSMCMQQAPASSGQDLHPESHSEQTTPAHDSSHGKIQCRPTCPGRTRAWASRPSGPQCEGPAHRECHGDLSTEVMTTAPGHGYEDLLALDARIQPQRRCRYGLLHCWHRLRTGQSVKGATQY